MEKKAHKAKKQRSKMNLLPIAAVVVAAAAVAVTLAPRLLPKGPESDAENIRQVAHGENVVIEVSGLSAAASFFDYDAQGVTVELFAVEASDGTTRLALNTCQVCNGSPYAYFIQEGDSFICQNCKNRFASTRVGIVSGGCNPIPITEKDYVVQDGSIVVSSELLDGFAGLFTNWKKL